MWQKSSEIHVPVTMLPRFSETHVLNLLRSKLENLSETENFFTRHKTYCNLLALFASYLYQTKFPIEEFLTIPAEWLDMKN